MLLTYTTQLTMASYANIDKNDANALHLLGVMKAVISDVRNSHGSPPKKLCTFQGWHKILVLKDSLDPLK